MQILGRVHGHIAALDVAVKVREISLGGLSMETAFPFPPGVIHEFRLELGDGSSVEMKGRVLRSRQIEAADGTHVFVSGVQFVEDDASATEASVYSVVNQAV